jgi:hypothetical protein
MSPRIKNITIARNGFVRILLVGLIIICVIAFSCSSRKNKLDRSGLIPEKELISILTDLYLSDGLMTLPKVHHWFPNTDSTVTYLHVIEKHGYTKQTMDKTMKFYYIRNPKKLVKIYDKVLGVLSEMDSRYEKDAARVQEILSNIWPGGQYYFYPDKKSSGSIPFNPPLYSQGYYVLTYTATVFPDDESFRPGLRSYTCHPDSLNTGKKHYYYSPEYIKDGLPHSYRIVYTVPLNTRVYLNGLMYDCDNNTEGIFRHAEFENISLIYSMVIP